ncbi:hypothetical protein VPHF99_0303 [Vibrio phage F99]
MRRRDANLESMIVYFTLFFILHSGGQCRD